MTGAIFRSPVPGRLQLAGWTPGDRDIVAVLSTEAGLEVLVIPIDGGAHISSGAMRSHRTAPTHTVEPRCIGRFVRSRCPDSDLVGAGARLVRPLNLHQDNARTMAGNSMADRMGGRPGTVAAQVAQRSRIAGVVTDAAHLPDPPLHRRARGHAADRGPEDRRDRPERPAIRFQNSCPARIR